MKLSRFSNNPRFFVLVSEKLENLNTEIERPSWLESQFTENQEQELAWPGRGRAELGPGAAICRIYIWTPLINTGHCPTPPAWSMTFLLRLNYLMECVLCLFFVFGIKGGKSCCNEAKARELLKLDVQFRAKL